MSKSSKKRYSGGENGYVKLSTIFSIFCFTPPTRVVPTYHFILRAVIWRYDSLISGGIVGPGRFWNGGHENAYGSIIKAVRTRPVDTKSKFEWYAACSMGSSSRYGHPKVRSW
jgi:hypothetical protein